jgi:5-methylcytosine-specific restriction endonuclease McrA
MTRWAGWRIARIREAVEHTYGRNCWICGHTIQGTISIDHLIPKSQLPEEDWWDITLLRPSHLRCNLKRGTKSAAEMQGKPKPSRRW